MSKTAQIVLECLTAQKAVMENVSRTKLARAIMRKFGSSTTTLWTNRNLHERTIKTYRPSSAKSKVQMINALVQAGFEVRLPHRIVNGKLICDSVLAVVPNK